MNNQKKNSNNQSKKNSNQQSKKNSNQQSKKKIPILSDNIYYNIFMYYFYC
jgi:hypothetical protein